VNEAALSDLLLRARREIDEGLLPASQIAVASDGELIAFETYGDATNDTRFVIFSATKAFVCSAFWILLGEGTVSLSQRVAEIVPGFEANGKDAVTIEHVLSHGAGFPDAGLRDPFDWYDEEARLHAFAAWRLDWEPGTAFKYHAMSALWLLADIIERATGADYRDFLRTRVVEPIGLKSFGLGLKPDEPDRIADVVVVGEPASPDQPPTHHDLLATMTHPKLLELGIPAGGGVSTAADVATFYQALLRNEPALWDPDVLLDATTRIRNAYPETTTGLNQNYGLGVRIASNDGRGIERGLVNLPRAFGHDGAGGMIAWGDHDSGLSFCYLTNGLDENLVRQWRRTAGLAHRAAALAT
jgi:CubicO group peptidase (beta-lactamase class C family)